MNNYVAIFLKEAPNHEWKKGDECEVVHIRAQAHLAVVIYNGTLYEVMWETIELTGEVYDYDEEEPTEWYIKWLSIAAGAAFSFWAVRLAIDIIRVVIQLLLL